MGQKGFFFPDDLAQVWSNDRYHAPEHRVLTAAVERTSAPFFFNPGFETKMRPLPQLGEPKYKPLLWGYYRAQVRVERPLRLHPTRPSPPTPTPPWPSKILEVFLLRCVLSFFFIRRYTPFSQNVAPRFPHMSEMNSLFTWPELFAALRGRFCRLGRGDPDLALPRGGGGSWHVPNQSRFEQSADLNRAFRQVSPSLSQMPPHCHSPHAPTDAECKSLSLTIFACPTHVTLLRLATTVNSHDWPHLTPDPILNFRQLLTLTLGHISHRIRF